MPSAINPLNPTEGEATTLSVRENFAAAKSEIEALQTGKQTILSAYSQWVPQQQKTSATQAIIPVNSPTGASMGTTAIAANRLILSPFVAPADGTLQALYARITTGIAGNARLGIYEPAALDYLWPGALLYDSGDISTAAGATISLAAALTVTKGEIYFAAILCSSTPTISTVSSVDSQGIFPSSSTVLQAATAMLYMAQTYGALPSDLAAAALLTTGTINPAFGIKYT